jgi:aminopeptidase N
VIRREDYRPPAWLVSEVNLTFHLGVEMTRVSSVLKVQRNPQGWGPDDPAERRRADRAGGRGG